MQYLMNRAPLSDVLSLEDDIFLSTFHSLPFFDDELLSITESLNSVLVLLHQELVIFVAHVVIIDINLVPVIIHCSDLHIFVPIPA